MTFRFKLNRALARQPTPPPQPIQDNERCYLADRLYIPTDKVRLDKVKKTFERYVFKQNMCNRCDVYKSGERFSELCQPCQAFTGFFKTWSEETIRDEDFYAVPAGNLNLVQDGLGIDLQDFHIEDLRSDVKAKHPLTFTGKLFTGRELRNGKPSPDQARLLKEFYSQKRGTIQAPPRFGKCLTKNSLIATEKGFRYINDLVSADKALYVNTYEGPKKAFKFYKKYSKTIKLVTNNGYTVEGTPEHPVLTLSPRLALVWKRLDSLTAKDVIVLNTKSVWSKQDFLSLEDAELLGYIVANGHCFKIEQPGGALTISTNNKQVQARLRVLFKTIQYREYMHKGVWHVTTHAPDLRARLVSFGLRSKKAADKHIPFAVMQSSQVIMTAFISAYMTCDVYVPINDVKNINIEVCTASKRLHDELKTILLAYGIISSSYIKRSWARNGRVFNKKLYYGFNIGGLSHLRFLKTFKLLKPVRSNNCKNDNKYLAYQVPFIHSSIHAVASKYRKKVTYEVQGRKLDFSFEKAGIGRIERGEGLVARSTLKKALPWVEKFSAVEPDYVRNYQSVVHNDHLVYDTVKSISTSGLLKKPVYDLTVEDVHHYTANGIVCHNTLVGTHIICKYRRRVLVVAHEKQLLRQFYKTILKFTNLRTLRRETGEKIVGIIQDDRDWLEEWDVVFCTYQKFIREKGFERVKKHLINKFAVVMVDEAHLSPAAGYSRFISKLNMKYKIALTATPKRKDQLDFILEQVMGPVVAKSEVVSMIPQVEVDYTKYEMKRQPRGMAAYTHINRWLSENKDRKRDIVRQIFKDLRANPKHCIMIPVLFVKQAQDLAKLINAQAKYNNENRGENWSDELAVAYFDDKKKQQSYLLDEARKGDRVRVLIGIRKMFKVGIDVPAWTHMYLTFPMNNQEDFYQMTQRICTPYEGKPQPVLRMIVDPIGLSQGCFIATYHHINHYKYTLTQSAQQAVQQIFAAKAPKERDDVEGW